MNWLDIVILIILLMAAFFGWKTGVIRAVVTLAGFAAGVFLAGRFFDELGGQLESIISNENGAKVAAFLIIFTAVMAGAIATGIVLRQILTLLLLGWLDRTAGGAFGALVGASVSTGLALLLINFPVGGLDKTVDESVLGSFLVDKYPVVISLLPSEFERITELSPSG